MALTQMQIIQSLGEAMSWFERELEWGVEPTELRHLSGRIGELYSALITNGQMAIEVNQKGYDVVSSTGEKISVKTTAKMDSNGHILFNPSTLGEVDRIIILKINTEEMQIEILFNEIVSEAQKLMTQPNANGKVSIALSKLVKKQKERTNIATIKTVNINEYTIQELENGTIEILKDNKLATPTKPILRIFASKFNINLLNNNGNKRNTRQLGSLIIKAIQSQQNEDI